MFAIQSEFKGREDGPFSVNDQGFIARRHSSGPRGISCDRTRRRMNETKQGGGPPRVAEMLLRESFFPCSLIFVFSAVKTTDKISSAPSLAIKEPLVISSLVSLSLSKKKMPAPSNLNVNAILQFLRNAHKSAA